MTSARVVLVPMLAAAVAGGACLRPPVETATSDAAAAEHYVKLVLALGLHDPNFVDAYYGPPAWRTEVEQAQWPLQEINKRAAVLEVDLRRLPEVAPPSPDAALVRLDLVDGIVDDDGNDQNDGDQPGEASAARNGIAELVLAALDDVFKFGRKIAGAVVAASPIVAVAGIVAVAAVRSLSPGPLATATFILVPRHSSPSRWNSGKAYRHGTLDCPCRAPANKSYSFAILNRLTGLRLRPLPGCL